MAFLAPLIPLLTVASLGVGIASGVKSLTAKPQSEGRVGQAPAPAPLPEAPKVEDAQAKAKAELDKKRRISFLSGGKTNVTQGKALVSESEIGRNSLLGGATA